jgi:hypothetical protein
MRRAGALVVVLLALSVRARAADAPGKPTAEGVWTATNASGQAFRGFWTADVAAETPNVALGTWTLTNGIGDIVMNGTWSARRAPRGWRGTWSARVAVSNQVLSGSWEADDSKLKGAKTFRDMLALPAQKQIAGVWRMGHAHGNWWLSAR